MLCPNFGSCKTSKVDADATTIPQSRKPLIKEPRYVRKSTLTILREAVATAYLRAAQAYMLISMPTGTSTIFGAFQAIFALLAKPDELRPAR
jgi:hypothetical protein